jgi:hypothetical protein
LLFLLLLLIFALTSPLFIAKNGGASLPIFSQQ